MKPAAALELLAGAGEAAAPGGPLTGSATPARPPTRPTPNPPPLPGPPSTQKIRENTVFATTYAKPGDYNQPWDPDVAFVASHDFFAHFDKKIQCGNMFELVGRSIYLAYANACPTDINGKK